MIRSNCEIWLYDCGVGLKIESSSGYNGKEWQCKSMLMQFLYVSLL